jgi:hypothetical protein
MDTTKKTNLATLVATLGREVARPENKQSYPR